MDFVGRYVEMPGHFVESIRYNDWRQVALPAPGAFTPELPVSVVVPYYAAPAELARTLAALEGQTYPRGLFEVVVVDDGSPEPLARPRSTPLDVKVVRQEDRGFGAPRARNTGVRAAAHDIVVFLDGDMLPEAGWLAAHARWHHEVPDAVTLGLWDRVPVDGIDAETIRNRPGTLKELFEGRKGAVVSREWLEFHLSRTDDLTSRADDLFRVVASGNLGVRREFYELVGGFDESFTQWGMEDTEFGYRAYTRGGLLVPARDAFAWHQGPWEEEGRADKEKSLELQRAKCAHLIAHRGFRSGLKGRTFTVPQYVVTLRGDGLPAERLLKVVEHVLAGPMHDLVVRVELDEDHPALAWLERQLGPDPRVRVVAPARSALEEFPASSFHVDLPAGKRLHEDVVHRLRAELGTAVVGRAVFPGGSRASITRAWALHRALRAPGEPDASDFGVEVTIPFQKLLPASAGTPASSSSASLPRAEYPLGVEIVALGARARAVFRVSRRVARTLAGQHVDVVVADTAAEAAAVEAPVVVLADAPPLLSVPAFDPRVDNPVGWQCRVEPAEVAALGPPKLLPPGCRADRVVRRDDRAALQRIHHLEDVQAFHPTAPSARAGELVRLAALGVVVHLADGDRRLAPYLGAELFELMTRDVQGLDVDAREALSVRMRRAALREHSLGSRVRQVAERALADPPRLPLVSILLVTRRPELLARALAAVRRQTYPRLELVLGLHGEGFGEVAPRAAGQAAVTVLRLDAALPLGSVLNAATQAAVTVLRLDAALPLGSALNAATQAARGTLLTKMDDDDMYGPEHVWDLVLAREYSRAELVGKGQEFAYLAASDRTIRQFSGGGEQYGTTDLLAGGTLLITRHMLDRVGGWKRSRQAVDQALIHAVARTGSMIYRAHPHGFRSSFRDWAAEKTDHPREVIEAALAHVVPNKVEAAYARSDLFERRRLLMDDWARYVDGGSRPEDSPRR